MINFLKLSASWIQSSSAISKASKGISWKLAIPEMVDKLQLPFREEYELAEKMHKTGK
ncbi:MAG: hypothetical protein MH321_02800 [Leptospiraceae bacterium]|nr:hypothetical protein [Leptospiraceae bacterium]